MPYSTHEPAQIRRWSRVGLDSRPMEVQIFGIRKSTDTRKALRFFAERRIKTHFVDLQERAASPGELRRFAQKFGVAGAGRPRVAPVRRPRARRRPAERRALAREARRGAAAPPDAARAPPAAAHRRRRRGHLARLDRPVTQLAISGVAVEFGATRLLGDVTLHRGARRAVGHHRPQRLRARPRCSASSRARPSRPPAPSRGRAGSATRSWSSTGISAAPPRSGRPPPARSASCSRSSARWRSRRTALARGGRPLHAADAGPVRPRPRALRARGRLHARRPDRRGAPWPRLRPRRGAHPAARRG